MADWENNPFAKKYKAKNAKTKALLALQKSKVPTDEGKMNILKLDNKN